MPLNLVPLINLAVQLGDEFTKSTQPDVIITRWAGQDGSGDEQYASPITVKAIVVYKQVPRHRRGAAEAELSRAYVAVLQPIEPITPAVAGRVDPIDDRDMVTLPDGTVSPILAAEGLVNPTISRPYYHEIWLGSPV